MVRGDETSFSYERKIQPMPKLGPWVEGWSAGLRPTRRSRAGTAFLCCGFMKTFWLWAMAAATTRCAARPGPGGGGGGCCRRRVWSPSTSSARQSGAIHQGRQERDQMDAAVVPLMEVPRQCRPAPASHPGLVRFDNNHYNLANFMRTLALTRRRYGTLVSDHTTGKVGEDRCCSFATSRWPTAAATTA